MKNIKRLVICLLVIVISTFDVHAKVKESTVDYTTDMYVIGSTRFDGDFTITGTRAAKAGVRESYIQGNVYFNSEFNADGLKTYYYSSIENLWRIVPEEPTDDLIVLTEDEVKELENNLNIFYVNNDEKTLEVPFNEKVDDGSIQSNLNGKASVENGKIIIPATWINGFTFTSDGANVQVEMGLGKEEGMLDEYPEPVIKMDAKIDVNLPSEVKAGDIFEFSVDVKANGNEGLEVTTIGGFSVDDPGVGKLVDSLKYYDEEASTWKEISNISEAFGSTLKEGTYKFKVSFVNFESGSANFNMSMSTKDGKTFTAKESMFVYASDSVVLVNGNDYHDLEVAFASNKNGTFKLLEDATVYNTIILDNENVTLDLNGKTLTFDGAGVKLRIGKNTNMTVKNGTIKGLDYTLQAEDDATLTVTKDVNIILDDPSVTANKYGIAYWDKSTVNFEGNITVTGNSIGISGNGNLSNTGKLNITGGSITASEGFGIYLPNDGVTTISGGEINAHTGIAIRSGKLNVTGGKINATGEKVTPVPRTGGINLTGDAIYIEEHSSYADNIKIDLAGGEISSKNSYVIQEVNSSETQSSVITGKYTTKHIIKYGNLVAYYYDDSTDTGLTVTERGAANKYSTDDLGVLALNMKEGTIKLDKDVEVDKLKFIGKVTLDLNGKTLSVIEANKAIISDANANLTVKNGTVKGLNYVFQVEDDAVLNIEKDVTIIADGKFDEETTRFGVTMWENGTLNFEGNIKVTGGIGISGNGQSVKYNSTLNITGGTITVEDGVGVYIPQPSKTTISGGEIVAPTGINIKAGTLDMTGGSIKATGKKVAPTATTGKTNETGDAIIIEENDAYADNIKINITGGTLESANGYILQEYNPTLGTNKELTCEVTGKYTVKNTINDKIFYYTEE